MDQANLNPDDALIQEPLSSAEDELQDREPKKAAAPDLSTRIRDFFWPMFSGMGGIDDWLVHPDRTPSSVFERLENIDSDPLSRAQFNQLLILSHQAGMSPGFFSFYWLSAPGHPYEVEHIGGVEYDPAWLSKNAVSSLPHLRWGFYRFYVDALLCFGNVRAAYRALRDLSEEEIARFFEGRRIDTGALSSRGAPLPLKSIAKDSRYLIAEMACKSLEGGTEADLVKALTEAYERHVSQGGSAVVAVDELIAGDFLKAEYEGRQQQLQFSADDLMGVTVSNAEELQERLMNHQRTFEVAREAALENTRLYLSMVEELDAYVATSMRTRQDFRDMAAFCDEVFADPGLRSLEVRYFDPTLSAAQGHVDKGLIECLMVKAAKVLVYFAGEKETLGKDAEFTMALSQGKPVVIYCENTARERLYRDIHPLTRLIDFTTGIAVGAMVTTSKDVVAELLNRILRNTMEYELAQTKPGFLVLREGLTSSVVRLQTSDAMLQETFWNYFRRQAPTPNVGAV
jgi:hypothetical protein